MAVTHSTVARSAATDAVTALIAASGRARFRLAGTVAAPGASVANLGLSVTAFPASVSGTATANAITSDTNAAGNATAVSTFTLETTAGVVVIHCAVAASASDVNLTNGLLINAGDTVSMSSLTYTALIA